MNRHLKVRKTWYEYRPHAGIKPRPVPRIELRGYWLEKAGFQIGTEVLVSLKQGSLVITVADNAE